MNKKDNAGTVCDATRVADAAPDASAKKRDDNAFLAGIIIAMSVCALCTTALDGGGLYRMACFTIPIYGVSTALIRRRAQSQPLPSLDRLLLSAGFPLYLSVFFILNLYKTKLISDGVISWQGIF